MRPRTLALLVAYAACGRPVVMPRIEEMLMIELPGCMTRPADCAIQYDPLRLRSTMRNWSSLAGRGNRGADAGVVDQHVDASELLHRGVDDGLALRRIRDVGGHRQCGVPVGSMAAAVSARRPARRAASTTSAPAFGEPGGERDTEARRCAGHDDDFVLD